MLLCFRESCVKVTRAEVQREAPANVAKLIQGDRVGKQGTLRASCSATIFDFTGQKVLLTRRSNNGRWCLPGGAMDPGESAAEACAREVLEETGLIVRIGRLIGVYTTPNRIVEYADGNRIQAVALGFEAKPTGGELRISDETTGVGYFSQGEMESMDVMEPHYERIIDGFAGQEAAFVR